MKWMFFSFVLVPLTCFAGDYDDLNQYFPSSLGNSWVYLVGDSTVAKSQIIKSENQSFMLSMVGKIGYRRIYEWRGNKLLSLSNQLLLDGKAINNFRDYDNPDVELISPLKKNTKWEYNNNGDGKTKCSIDIIESMTVKAGTFTNIVKRSCLIYSKEKNKWKQLKGVGSVVYYAPNVGMIMMESETSKTKHPWYELVEYSINNKTNSSLRGIIESDEAKKSEQKTTQEKIKSEQEREKARDLKKTEQAQTEQKLRSEKELNRKKSEETELQMKEIERRINPEASGQI